MSDDGILPSGRKYRANQGIIGIDREGHLAQGYDGPMVDEDWTYYDEWTEQELNDLADILAERVKLFRSKIPEIIANQGKEDE